MRIRVWVWMMAGLFFVSSGFAAGTSEKAGVSGKALIKGTSEGSSLTGNMILTETEEGLKVSGFFENAAPGKHGFHIHEKGDCSDAGKAAGGHYNPMGSPHGDILRHDMSQAHAGDFGNVEIGPDGTGSVNLVAKGLTLKGGAHPVEGLAFILHEKEDDFGQPTGNAGGRIGCGVIEVDL